ncbi:MAG: hypothetical protein NUV94_07335 [Candidatus Acetothermia bacterium]|nr:hypothetical protein [Candidatus Acetothermia bacterium]
MNPVYTVSELVRLLGLSTENQVRNRIEAVRDLLAGAIRRGPNNQILLTEDGLSTLRDLQALCETGYTLTDAANLLRYKTETKEQKLVGISGKTEPNRDEPGDVGWRALVEHLAEDVRRLADRVAALEVMVQREIGQAPWWERWR